MSNYEATFTDNTGERINHSTVTGAAPVPQLRQTARKPTMRRLSPIRHNHPHRQPHYLR